MEREFNLTQEEQMRIRDLANTLVKKQDSTKKREEIIGKIAAFIEGVKLGLINKPTT